MSTPINMKRLILLCICICLITADSSRENTKKPANTKTTNTSQQYSKHPVFYQQFHYQSPQQLHQIQHAPKAPQQTHQLIPIQLIPKPFYPPHAAQQPTMVIIAAHPAVVTPSVLYGTATQQLLNYFHSNPQAKYQLLHGNQQHQQQPSQPHYVPQVTPSQTIGTYQIVPAPVPYHHPNVMVAAPQVPVNHFSHFQAAHPAQPAAGAQPYHAPPMQLTQLAHLAQLAAQQYATSSLRSAPAIVTGFENFTPDQQAQIKAQLATHLGTPVNLHSPQNQYSSKYVASQQSSLNTDEFMPSQSIKNDISSNQNSAESTSKTQYHKG